MRDSTRFVGLDYHQDSVQVCIMDHQGQIVANRSCANDAGAIVAAVGEGPVQAAIEACSGAADLAEELVEAGWSVHLAHAGYVHRLKQSPDKSDWSDARLLADLLRVGYLPRVWLAPAPLRELRRLVRYRQMLANQRRAVKLRIRALLREHRAGAGPAKAWTQAWYAWAMQHEKLGPTSQWIMQQHHEELEHVGEQLRRTEQEMEAQTRDDPIAQRLRQQPGVGLITASVLRAEIGRFDRFASGKQLARFCGLSPRNASSGAHQADGGLMPAASRRLRTTMIEAAWQIIRFDPHWQAKAAAMRRRGKPATVTIAAVANRWVRRLYHAMQSDRFMQGAIVTSKAVP